MTTQLTLNKNYKHLLASALLHASDAALGTIVTAHNGSGYNALPIANIVDVNGAVVPKLSLAYTNYNINFKQICLKVFSNLNGKTGNETYFEIGYNEHPSISSQNDICLAKDATNPVDENNESTAIDTNMYALSLSATSYMEDENGVLNFFVCIQNTSNETISINEIGLFKTLPSPTHKVMIGRGVLPQTIELGSGKSITLSVKISFIN